MKKRYFQKQLMGQDLSEKLGISLQDALSRISRQKPETDFHEVDVDGEKHNIRFYLTPAKWLERAEGII